MLTETPLLQVGDGVRHLQAAPGEVVLLDGVGSTRWLKRFAGLCALPAGMYVSLAGELPPAAGVRMLPDRWPRIWLGQTVAEELLFGLSRRPDADEMEVLLAEWGLTDLSLERDVATLDREQSLCLMLAAMQLAEPSLVLLDQPTAALTDAAVQSISTNISRWALAAKLTVVVVSSRWQDWRHVASQYWRSDATDHLPTSVHMNQAE